MNKHTTKTEKILVFVMKDTIFKKALMILVKLADNYVVNVLIQPIVKFVLIFLKLDIKKLKIMSVTVAKGIS
jgi:hypothetical protein